MPKQYSELLTTARDAQLKTDWCGARETFQKLSDQLSSDKSALAELRDEVDRNLRMLATLCPDKVTPESKIIPKETKIEVPPKNSPPKKVPEEVLMENYPVGKTIRSVGRFIVNGKGRNTKWGIRGEASFSYFALVPMVTRVVENNARMGRVVVEQSFADVVQVRGVSNQTLELVSPDSPVLRTVWPTIDQQLRSLSPGYVAFRKLVDAINSTDPGLKETLTTASEWLRRVGVDISTQPPDTELAMQVAKLSGSRFKIIYLSGLGVTSIEQLEGEPFNRAELIQHAHASTVLVDYFVFSAAKRQPGEKWDVQADDVAGVFALYDPTAEIGGTISLRRGKDAVAGQVARLEVVGGAVTADGIVDGKEQRGRLTVRDGTMSFDLKDMYISGALIKFSASSLFQSRNHLMYGTEQLRDIKVESRYEAELVAPKAKAPAAKSP